MVRDGFNQRELEMHMGNQCHPHLYTDTDIGAFITVKMLLSHSQVRVGCQLCLCIALSGTFVKAPAAAVAEC